MSPNDEKIQEATLLFVSQLRARPIQVCANINALLEGMDFRLAMVEYIPPQPEEYPLFERAEAVGVVPPHQWQPPPEMVEV